LRILAIETSGTAGSLAALHDDNLLAELMLDTASRSARSLAPGIAALLRQVGWRPNEVDVLAVALGPGSFTGLRVGVTTAKTFAYATGAGCVGVGTLEVIAEQAAVSAGGLVTPVIEAQRGDVYTALYQRTAAGSLDSRQSPVILSADEWLATLADGRLASGPALETLADRLPPNASVALPPQWPPTAATVGRLAYRKHVAGQRDDIWRLTPLYLRRSAAEEKAGK
jgi:tRNA threonylcarbamoyladenosine biosynthesis protein TsaB